VCLVNELIVCLGKKFEESNSNLKCLITKYVIWIKNLKKKIIKFQENNDYIKF